jgi:two-component system sensor histidine kinase UhpB
MRAGIGGGATGFPQNRLMIFMKSSWACFCANATRVECFMMNAQSFFGEIRSRIPGWHRPREGTGAPARFADPDARDDAMARGEDGAETANAARTFSLRQKISLLFVVVGVLLLVVLATVAVQSARNGVREEIDASNRIAAQLLERVARLHALGGLDSLAGFLAQTGRIRANEVLLFDRAGNLLYQSPPSRYKAGRDAPAWYAALVTPELREKIIMLPSAILVVVPNPGRAVLDAWDDLRRIFLLEALLLLAADLAIFWMVGRWLAPLVRIEDGLRDIAGGGQHVRLPPLPGREAGALGRTFNRMAQAVEENLEAKKSSAEARARLAAQREFMAVLQSRIEEERAALARELHDEFGQSLTAIRSIAKSLAQHPDLQGSPLLAAAQILYDTAGSSTDALQRMIPRLRPVQLEGMGLADALRDLIGELRLRQGLQAGPAAPRYELIIAAPLPVLPEAVELTAYRIAQEALNNAARHANASLVVLLVELVPFHGLQGGALRMTVSDNGRATDGEGELALARPGHYGVLGMRERAEQLGGSITFRRRQGGGLEVDLLLPLERDSV